MRQSAQLAAHHATHRKAFGTALADQPLMRSVLVDLAIETEAANALWPRLARSFESRGEGEDNEHEMAFRRIATAIGKYWVCKRAVSVAYESMECLGGNGYVEVSSQHKQAGSGAHRAHPSYLFTLLYVCVCQ